VNRIQNIRKDIGFEVTDKVEIRIQKHDAINQAIESHKEYIGSQTLAAVIELVETLVEDVSAKAIELDEEIRTLIRISKN
jgi:isoleucyl-tRNA synthetase